MNLTRSFLLRPTLTFVFVAITLLAGVFALRTLVVQQTPNTGQPTINVQVSYSGASTTDLQTEVAEPIEDAIAGAPYLDHINTTIETGSVSISAAFALTSTDTENIANVEKALQAAQRQLPTTIQAPTIRVADPSQPNVVTLSLVSKKYTQVALGALANNQIVPAIEQYQGVSQASVLGTTQAAFEVLVNPNLLAADNLTITDVVNAIAPNNLRAPGGIVYQKGRETQIDVRGDVFDQPSIANLPIHVAYSATGGTTATGGSGGGSVASSSGASGSGASGSGVSGSGGGTGGGTASAGSGGSSSAAGSTAATGAGGAGSGLANSAGARTVPVPFVASATKALSQSTGVAAAPQTSPTSAATPAPVSVSDTVPSSSTTGTMSSGVGAGSSSATGTAGTGSTGGGSSSGTSGATGSTGATTSSSAAESASGSASGTSSTGSVTTSSSIASQSASANVTVDTPVQVSSTGTNTNGATTTSPATTSSEAATMPNGTASGFGSGSGTSLSPVLGTLNPWGVPSADKRIGDVAKVVSGSVVQRVYASLDGHSGVAMNVQKNATASEVTVANEVIAALPKLRAQFPGIDFEVAHNQSTFTEQQLEGVEHTLVEGIVLTAVVMLFFLKSWRNAVVVMVAIPTSLGVTLFVMKLLNLTLDTISLMAMTLVIGILIDDSTVVLENIERHRAMGEEPADSALNGRSEIGQAAVVITMVDVVVFLPIAFASGQVGAQLSEFGIVVAVATVTSLFVSFTVTPVLAGLWSMKSEWKPWPIIRWFDDRFNGLSKQYSERWLPAMMKRPWPILVVSIVLCVLAFLLVPSGWVGEEYQPTQDQGIIYAQVTLPPGHPLSETHALMTSLEAKVKQTITGPDYASEQTIAGGYSAEFGGFVQEGNVGQISIYLATDHKTPTATYVDRLQKALAPMTPPNSLSVVQATQQGGGVQQPIDELVSDAAGDPTPDAQKVFEALKGTPGAIGVQDSATNAAPQVEVDFDRAKLQALDVSVGTAATAIEAAFGGDQATQIETPSNGLTEILVEYPIPYQNSLASLLDIPLRSQDGAGDIVRLGDVAHLRWAPAPLVLTRENRQQVVHVSGNVGAGYNLSDVTKDFQQRVKKLGLPKSVTVHPAAQGQQDLMNQALVTLGSSLLISFVLVFLMIVALYDSYRTPFVTLFAIPLATIGAFGALWITHSTLNLYSLIGMVLLVGLVTKNGILLVDYADTVREREGRSREEGIRESASTRFRPIMMTTIAMIAGMAPLALGLEPGGQSRASLAIAVIGGLTSSLLLTLFIVPIMYAWLAPKQLRQKLRFASDAKNAKRPPEGPQQPGAPIPAPS